MNVRLPYGRGDLEVSVPEGTAVLAPRDAPPVTTPELAIRTALRDPRGTRPLRSIATAGATVGISICDVTRAFPARQVLPVVLDELEGTHVTLLVATGTHRECTDAELRAMLGEAVLHRTTVVQHVADDRDRHVSLGRIPGTRTEALIERAFLDADVRITLGFIEPHFFAGFSGGPKMVAPGLAALETVLELHSAGRIGHPAATWGVLEGNPVHEPIRWIARRAGVDFALDVTLDSVGRITGVFAGSLPETHPAGCEFAWSVAMVPVDEPFDVVIATNGGYPLDQNLYQSVKGMSAAAQIVRDGGAIVMATECSDGMPDHGRYASLLASSPDPAAFIDRLSTGTAEHDQWQAQVQAKIQARARVFVKAGGLTPEQLRRAWLEPVEDLGRLVDGLWADGARRVAVLPHGPQTIPYVIGAPPGHPS
jgi:nickel-dependent lactate racemase